jgi:ABC-type iron transport system FetAB ATPase subunit
MNIEELTKKLEKNREEFLRKERDLNISISMSLTYDEAILRLDELKTAYEEEKKKIEREIYKIKSKKAQ